MSESPKCGLVGARITFQPIPDEVQKKGICHMTESFIPVNHNYIILLRNIPESGGYRIADLKAWSENWPVPSFVFQTEYTFIQ